jgi:hypothetical protein
MNTLRTGTTRRKLTELCAEDISGVGGELGPLAG